MKNIKDFSNKKEFYKYLVTNKSDIINLKKATIKFSDAFGTPEISQNVNKSLHTSYKDDIESGIITRTIIGNTYNWMDSSDDVLLDGCFKKSIEENQDKIFHLHDHQYQITGKVGKPKKIYEKQVGWTDLGIVKMGQTECLMMESEIHQKYNGFVFLHYANGDISQHSVGMQYQKIDLAINDPEEKVEFAVWAKHISKVGNLEKAMEKGYFWAVSEGKLREISAVLAGANELTPTLDNKKSEDDPKIICLKFNELLQNYKKNEKKDENIIAELKTIIIFAAEIITSHTQPPISTDLKKPIDLKSITKNFKL